MLRGLVLYNDAKYIVVNKPALVAMQALPHAPAGKAWAELLEGAQAASGTSEPLRTVHRLDSGTSGALILAKSAAAAKIMATQFRTNQVKKTYLAIADHGSKGWQHGKEGLCEATMRITETGVKLRKGKANSGCSDEKDATASWTYLDERGRYSLIQWKPITGRKHQLRLMSAKLLGSPVVGDFKYGYSGDPVTGHLLHCSHLEFYSWQKNGKRETISITAQLPQTFRDFAKIHTLSIPATCA